MKLETVESHLPYHQAPFDATTAQTSVRFPRGGCITDTSRRWLRYRSRFDPSKWSRPVASQRSTARNASQSVATTKPSQDDRPQIILQPCNFSLTTSKHSVTSLRGRVLQSCTHASCQGQDSVPEAQRRGFTSEYVCSNLNAQIPMLESLCRGLWSTNIPKQHHAILASNVVSLDNITDKPESYIEPRDLMSMPKCQIFKAQDCMPETLWYESTKGKARCQTLFYWLIKLFSMQHQDATLSNTASETHTISTSTANLVSQGLASTSDREGESTTPSSTQPLFRSLVSMFNLETPHKLLNAPKNKYSVSFISNLNPNIMQHLNLAQQIVHTMANANTREANNAAAAYSSQHLCIFQSNVNYLAAMSTANAHFIRAHRFVVNKNHTTINERFSSCYDECICAGSRHMIQDQLNALSGHFVPILSAWLFLYLAHNMNSGEDTTAREKLDVHWP